MHTRASPLKVEAWMGLLAAIKGALVTALLLAVANPSFLQALVIAATSATITGGALIIATYMQNRHTAAKVDEVKAAVETVAHAVDAETARATTNGEHPA